MNDVSKFEQVESTKKIEPIVVEPPQPPQSVPKKRKKWPIVVGIVGGIVVLSLLVFLLIGLLGPKQAIIPDVSEKDETEALSILEEEGFIVGDRHEQASDEIEAGKVIRTIPEAGKKTRCRTPVTLYVSTGKEKFELLDYTDLVMNPLYLLWKYGFRSIKPILTFSDEPEGTIIEQNPPAGTEIVPGETDLSLRSVKEERR